MHSANVEFKAELRDRPLARGLLHQLGFEHVGLLDQTDTYYRVVDGRLKRRATVWAAPPTPSSHLPAPDLPPAPAVEFIRYHRPDRAAPRLSRYERLSENEYRARYGPTPLAQIAVVSKQRELWVRGPVRAHLDRVEHLGDFAELEVAAGGRQAEAETDAADLRARLGPALGELIACGYLDLLLAARDPGP